MKEGDRIFDRKMLTEKIV